MWIAIAVFACITVGIGSSYFLGDDNPVEEVSEDVLEEILEKEMDIPGADLNGKIDFTPSSVEKDKKATK